MSQINNKTSESITLTPEQVSAIRCQKPILGLTHGFYRYPARFSPQLARSIIKAFTEPGDLVLDPFCGSATTLVEAAALGRRSIGVDISPLATFLARVKTRPIEINARFHIRSWAERNSTLTLSSPVQPAQRHWRELGYLRHLNSPTTWAIRKSLELLVGRLDELSDNRCQDFIRCAILCAGQWALDGRKKIPSAREFRFRFRQTVDEMLNGITHYTETIKNEWQNVELPVCLQGSAKDLQTERSLNETDAPKLILTSPPYPGVHMLYHRWQIAGRRETPAPFWLADELDGNGESFYTFGSRQRHDQGTYFDHLTDCFESIHNISDSGTVIAQVVGFSNPQRQLGRYLKTLADLGYQEMIPMHTGKNRPQRIWRIVPRRRWYTERIGRLSSSNEVLLFHRLCQHSA